MEKLFYCCIAAGLAIPLLNLLLGLLGLPLDGLGQSLDLDLDADVDGDGFFGGKLPVNLMTLSFAAVIFGAVGLLFLGRIPDAAVLCIALANALLGGYLLGRFVILPLKRNDSSALKMEQLEGRTGIVKMEIRSDFAGTISVLSSIGSKISYSALSAEGIDRIPVGTRVKVIRVSEDGKTCIVNKVKP